MQVTRGDIMAPKLCYWTPGQSGVETGTVSTGTMQADYRQAVACLEHHQGRLCQEVKRVEEMEHVQVKRAGEMEQLQVERVEEMEVVKIRVEKAGVLEPEEVVGPLKPAYLPTKQVPALWTQPSKSLYRYTHMDALVWA